MCTKSTTPRQDISVPKFQTVDYAVDSTIWRVIAQREQLLQPCHPVTYTEGCPAFGSEDSSREAAGLAIVIHDDGGCGNVPIVKLVSKRIPLGV